jgi:hypothetical protein
MGRDAMNEVVSIAVLVLACFVGCTVEHHYAAKDCHEAGGVWVDPGGCEHSQCLEPREEKLKR